MHNYNCKVVLHHYQKADGTKLLYLRTSLNGVQSLISLGVAVLPTDFDEINQRVVGGSMKDFANVAIDAKMIKARKIFALATANDLPLTKKYFESALNEKTAEMERGDFIAFYEKYMRIEAADKELSTFKSYRKAFAMLKAYRQRLPFSDLTISFVRDFDRFLKTQRTKSGQNKGKPYAANTISNIHKQVKKFISLAIDENELPIKNPYKRFSLSWLVGERVFLEPKELEKFVKLYDCRDDLKLPQHLCDTLQMFLFMVGCGLRISDSGRLEGLHITNDLLRIRMQKTKRWKLESTFPLSEFAMRYLPDGFGDGRLFKYKTSQKLNDNLKELCRYLGIRKNVTSHTARHTFATSFIVAGGNVAVLKNLLGHSDIKTTMAYVHLTKTVERKELKLLDAFLNFE